MINAPLGAHPPPGAGGGGGGGAGGAVAAEAATKADSAVTWALSGFRLFFLDVSGQYANTAWLPNRRRLA